MRRWVAVAVAVAALAGAGCGDDEDTTASEPEVAAPPATDSAERGEQQGDRKRERARDGGERRGGEETGRRDRTQRPDRRPRQLSPEVRRIRELLADAVRRGGSRPDPDQRRRIVERLRELLERRQAGDPQITDAPRHSLSRQELRRALAERERRERATGD